MSVVWHQGSGNSAATVWPLPPRGATIFAVLLAGTRTRTFSKTGAAPPRMWVPWTRRSQPWAGERGLWPRPGCLPTHTNQPAAPSPPHPLTQYNPSGCLPWLPCLPHPLVPRALQDDGRPPGGGARLRAEGARHGGSPRRQGEASAAVPAVCVCTASRVQPASCEWMLGWAPLHCAFAP